MANQIEFLEGMNRPLGEPRETASDGVMEEKERPPPPEGGGDPTGED